MIPVYIARGPISVEKGTHLIHIFRGKRHTKQEVKHAVAGATETTSVFKSKHSSKVKTRYPKISEQVHSSGMKSYVNKRIQ